MKIKKILLLIVIIFPLFTFAQKSRAWNKPLYDVYPYHYGFAFSAGILDFSVSHSDYFVNQDSVRSIEGKAGPVFGASMVGNLRLSPHWDLRFLPGLYFGQRNLEYLLVDDINVTDTSVYTHTMKIESTLLQFPLLFKYRAIRQNNYRPYIVFGTNYAIDFASRKKIREEEQPKIRLNKHDVFLEVGAGVDYYLPYFKLSTEIRFSYGLLNMVNYDGTQYTSIFDRLGSKMVTLLVYFE